MQRGNVHSPQFPLLPSPPLHFSAFPLSNDGMDILERLKKNLEFGLQDEGDASEAEIPLPIGIHTALARTVNH